MSLQIWLPLNGDLHNQGLSDITPSLMGSGIIYTSGKIGNAATFPNNANSCIYMPGFKQPNNFSWCCWFKCAGEGAANYQYILSEGRDYQLHGVNIYLSKAGTTLYLHTGSNDNLATSINLNQWYHVAAVFDNTEAYLYLDGTLISHKSYGTIDYTYSSDVFTIGKMSYSYSNAISYFPFNGQANDVRIYNHALSPKEIAEIAKGLALHYKLDDRFCEQTRNLVSGNAVASHSYVAKDVATYATSIIGKTFYGNKIFTYSVYIKNTSDNPLAARFSPYNADDSNYSAYMGNYIQPGQEGYSSVTVDITNTANWNGKVYLYIQNGISGSVPTNKTFYIREVQLEEMNHATPFTLAQRGAQYDKIIYQEPDGTQWLHIAHHNNPSSSGYFTQSSTWEQGVYVNADKWYDVEGVIPQISKYEFMVKQKTTSGATETKYRWVQYKNPLIATWDDVKPGTVTINTSSGYTSSSFGGLWKKNSQARLCIANASNGNWYGAFGCWTTYNTNQVPGYPNTNISTGYMDLYVNVTGLDFSTIYDSSGYSNNGAIIGSLTAAAGSPRYGVCTYMPKTTTITHPRPVFGGVDQEWTCSMWVKLDSTSVSNQQMNNFNSGNRIVHSADSYPLLYLNSGTNDYYNYGNLAVSANIWTHIVFVFKNSNATKLIYINGINRTNTGGPNKTSTPAGISDTVIVGTNLAGAISDYRVYATALTAAQVADLYRRSMVVDASGNISPRGLS